MAVTQIDARPKIAHVALIMFVLCGLFHFSQYAARSAPGVMLPELGINLGMATASIGSLIGSYYYTYSLTSVVAGGVLDRFGARIPVAAGMLMLALGCVMFSNGSYAISLFGRLLQGAGAAFAFTGAVYIATKSFPAAQLASAIGIVQAFGMFGGPVRRCAVGSSILGALVLCLVRVGRIAGCVGIDDVLSARALGTDRHGAITEKSVGRIPCGVLESSILVMWHLCPPVVHPHDRRGHDLAGRLS